MMPKDGRARGSRKGSTSARDRGDAEAHHDEGCCAVLCRDNGRPVVAVVLVVSWWVTVSWSKTPADHGLPSPMRCDHDDDDDDDDDVSRTMIVDRDGARRSPVELLLPVTVRGRSRAGVDDAAVVGLVVALGSEQRGPVR